MARIDRYMMAQLMALFGFFALILVLVYWINRAVILFDQLIADGQSAGVFLEFTALSLPNVIRLVLPIAAFAASVYVTNRLSGESEIAAMQATGHSAWRLARPVLCFGVTVTILMSILVHLLVPMSQARLEEREDAIARNLTARLLTEGTFLNPAAGITFYIRDITPEGELRDIFLSDTRQAGEHVTYTAERALLVRSDTGPTLVMVAGMVQTLDTADQRLFTTRFDDLAYDIGALITTEPRSRRRPRELLTAALFRADTAAQEMTRSSAPTLRQEAHNRVQETLLATVAALIGFSTLLAGGYSRFGVWPQICTAIFLLIVVKLVESTVLAVIDGRSALWPLTYLPVVAGLGIAAAQLWATDQPPLLRRRVAAPDPVPDPAT